LPSADVLALHDEFLAMRLLVELLNRTWNFTFVYFFKTRSGVNVGKELNRSQKIEIVDFWHSAFGFGFCNWQVVTARAIFLWFNYSKVEIRSRL